MQQVHTFKPSPENSRQFRDALGQFGTGVAVVTAASDQGPVGMTVNSFSSVSMDPPLVLWSPSKASSRFRHFEAARHFAIHILSQEQERICFGFAKSASAFDGLDWSASEQGVPLIEGCLSRFECRRSAIHDAGDHAIFVGEVETALTGTGAPLLFYKGKTGEFLKRE